MDMQTGRTVSFDCLIGAGLPVGDIKAWAAAEPLVGGEFDRDCDAFADFWWRSGALLDRLPDSLRRNSGERAAAETLTQRARSARIRFVAAHAGRIYDALTLTRSRFLRVGELVLAAAARYPGLVPTSQELAEEYRLPLCDKAGVEIDQGLFLSGILSSPVAGRHLCHAMLLPRPEARERLPDFTARGHVDLGAVAVERADKHILLTIKNPRFLNAEDETTIDALEIGVDLALLDESRSIVVLRGGPLVHPKYAGRRVFGSGINLTHLYRGRIPYLWYLQRDLGPLHKIYRGLAQPDLPLDDTAGGSLEKPWIAAVEGFAIGGHCQLLLTVDHVVAERNAFLSLPARKEGIIPGLANMRLPRFTGDRLARQAILMERRIDCDSPEGRLICDELVDPGAMDGAIDRVVTSLAESGLVSAAANRRAFRIAQEPIDMFRSYCAVYAREQAYCHFSPALIANLERHWIRPGRSS
ncbi:MAG: enoyl-CoA hydratase/isomerase family protein [Hyphomicrobiales bacterium]|nr:enoyl-CoA hydratase/isomerase family protein [Hyphomicrobiales bacterium]